MGNHLLPRAPSQAQPTELMVQPLAAIPTLRTGLSTLPQDSNIKRKKECQGQIWNQKKDSLDFCRPPPTPQVLSRTGQGEGRTMGQISRLLLAQLFREHCSSSQLAAVFLPLPPWCPLFLLEPKASIYRAPGPPGTSTSPLQVQSPRRPNGRFLPGRGCSSHLLALGSSYRFPSPPCPTSLTTQQPPCTLHQHLPVTGLLGVRRAGLPSPDGEGRFVSSQAQPQFTRA